MSIKLFCGALAGRAGFGYHRHTTGMEASNISSDLKLKRVEIGGIIGETGVENCVPGNECWVDRWLVVVWCLLWEDIKSRTEDDLYSAAQHSVWCLSGHDLYINMAK